MSTIPDPSNPPNWSQNTLEKLLFSTLTEQRRKRRWGIFFKLLFAFYILIFLGWMFGSDDGFSSVNRQKPHLALINVDGEIDQTMGVKADDINDSLQAAFKDRDTKAILLRINSPGGSPVQAANVYNELRYLEKEHPTIPVYAVCSDLCASAAYYIASGATKIYASPLSLVGSIGVLMDGFGFVGSMDKLGVQRRLLTAGDHKGFLDPFSPVKPEDQQIAQTLLDDVHQKFIHDVEVGRGNRLKIDAPNIFSGLVWTGQQALSLGLIDGYGDTLSISRDIFKNDNLVDYTISQNPFEKLAGRFGASFGKSIASELAMHWG